MRTLEQLTRSLVTKGEKPIVSREEMKRFLIDARDRLCHDCRNKVPFNMAGGHSFDIHARRCQAIEIRAVLSSEFGVENVGD